MGRIMIYPFGKETAPIMRNIDLINNEEVQLVTDTNPNIYIKEHLELDDNKIIYNLSDDFEKSLNESEIVYVPFEKDYFSIERYIEIIEKIIKSEKRVLLSRDLYEELANIEYKFADQVTPYNHRNINLKVKTREIFQINVPVIMVLGDGLNCNKFDIQLSLRSFFKNKGYSVSQLGTKEYSNLFGFDPLPSFIFEEGKIDDIIITLNHMVYSKIINEKPDLMIVGVPGGVLPISEEHPEDFGKFAYMITNAVKPDIAIRSLYNNNYTDEFFENDIQMCKYKLDSIVEYYNISNTRLIYPQEKYGDLTYLTVNNKASKNYIEEQNQKNIHYNLFNVLGNHNVEKTYERILEQLSQNKIQI
jgi:peptide maturation system protein (TIGR04066 family)